MGAEADVHSPALPEGHFDGYQPLALLLGAGGAGGAPDFVVGAVILPPMQRPTLGIQSGSPYGSREARTLDTEFEVGRPREIDPIVSEIALMKQLIKEKAQPLDLLRELISNCAAREVGSRNIKVTYYVHPEYGNVFQVAD